MTWYAVDAIDDALEATRAFLWPFDRGRWARLAVVAFFLGGVGGVNPLQLGSGTGGGTDAPTSPGGPGPSGSPAPSEALSSIGGPELAIIVAIVVVVAVLAVGFLFVGSVMEFVFVDSLRREEVTIRRYWREHWRRGLRLFGFRLVLGVATLAVVGLLLAVVLAPVVLGGIAVGLGLLLLVVPLLVVLSVVVGLVNGFTTMFVVPVMLVEGRAVVSAWRRFWPTLTGEWKQYAVYAVIGFVLQLAGGIVAGLATLVGALVVAIPLGIVGLLGAGLLTVVPIAGWVVIGVAVVVFGLAVLVLTLFVSVPVQTYLRYYALFVLGDTNDAFDVIADRRRAVRE
jgi:hypothetical protein